MRLLAFVAAGLLLAIPADAAVQAQYSVAVPMQSKAPPLLLAAGATGTTQLGASQASATTTRATMPATVQEVLVVKKGESGWDVRVRVDSATGFGNLDSATVSILVGAVSQPQVVVTAGAVTQATGTVLSLLPSGGDLSVRLVGTKLSSGPSTLQMTIVLVPTGGQGPVVSYSYSLTVGS
jgi:hypothetical protein